MGCDTAGSRLEGKADDVGVFSYQQVGLVHVPRLLRLKLSLTLQSMLGRPVQHRPHVVTHAAELPTVGRHQTPAGGGQSGSVTTAMDRWIGASPGRQQLEAELEAVRLPGLQQEAAISV